MTALREHSVEEELIAEDSQNTLPMTSSNNSFPFDFEYNRREVPALKYHRMVLGSQEEKEEDLFVAGVADMDFAVAPCITEALQSRLQHGLLGYEAVPVGLYDAVEGWMERRHGWNPGTGNLLRAPNVLNALAMALCAFTQEGDEVLVQPPVFFDFYDIVRENHRIVVENPLEYNAGRYTMNLKHLKELLTTRSIKLLFLCNPHNPVGRVWTRRELQDVADLCRAHQVLIVSDEIHADLCFTRRGAFTPMASIDPDHCIALHSPAKTFNIASCCSAFTIVFNKELREKMQAENSRLTVNKNNAFASVAMEAAYRHGDAWVDAMLNYVEGNVHLLRQRLHESSALSQRIQLVEIEGTFLVWLDCQRLGVDDSDGYALRTWFRTKAGWAVTRGAAFGQGGHGFVRVNVACPRQRLERALDRLETAAAEG